MALRTTRKSVTFNAPFTLKELNEVQPAGTYDIVTDEEIVEGNERNVYIRVATVLYIRTIGTTRMVTIDPRGLEGRLGPRSGELILGGQFWDTVRCREDCPVSVNVFAWDRRKQA